MAESGHDITRSDLLGGVAHGFFGHGGGRYQFGYGGEGRTEDIASARAAAASAICPGGRLAAPHQTHTPDVLRVDEAWDDTAEGRPGADALVTNCKQVVLGIVTADCAPVLFADIAAGVIGAAHAGWKGARNGVLENTIAAMEALGARRSHIAASIGPSIAQASYEVDAGFRKAFDAADDRFFEAGREGHWHFDLPAYAGWRLQAAGVEKIDQLRLDTYELEPRFFSYRRATHRREPNYGRQISLVALA